MSKISVEKEEITLEIAAKMLARNVCNRKISQHTVAGYKRDMLNGRFRVNGDMIRFSTDGTLLDGQHRLTACVEAGVSFETFVGRGFPPETIDTIDGGRARKHSDRLSMRGVKNANATSSVAKFLIAVAKNSAQHVQATSLELDAVLSRHPDISESVSQCAKSFPQTSTVLPAFHYMMTFVGHGDRADDMERVFRSGSPDYEGDPFHALRERLIRTRSTPYKLSSIVIQKLFTTAAKPFLESRPLTKIQPAKKLFFQGWTEDALWGDQ